MKILIKPGEIYEWSYSDSFFVGTVDNNTAKFDVWYKQIGIRGAFLYNCLHMENSKASFDLFDVNCWSLGEVKLPQSCNWKQMLAPRAIEFYFNPSEAHMGVSWNRATPKSSILIGFSFTNQPFWGTTHFRKPPYLSSGRHSPCFDHGKRNMRSDHQSFQPGESLDGSEPHCRPLGCAKANSRLTGRMIKAGRVPLDFHLRIGHLQRSWYTKHCSVVYQHVPKHTDTIIHAVYPHMCLHTRLCI